jgi:hypothetical protein
MTRVTMRELLAEARRVADDDPVVTQWSTSTWWTGWIAVDGGHVECTAPTRAAVMAGLYAALKTMKGKR